MFHDGRTNATVSNVCERALQMLYKDSESNSFYIVNKSLTIHQRNLKLLMIETVKTKNNVNLAFMKSIIATN